MTAFWRCPTSVLVARYREHIRDRHLDIGPGTGYFIARSGLASGSEVTIVDPNRSVLAHAARRLRHLDGTIALFAATRPRTPRGPA